MINKLVYSVTILVVFFLGTTFGQSAQLVISCADEQNDILLLLSKNGYNSSLTSNPLEAVKQAPMGSGVLILSDGYPFVSNTIDNEVFELAKQKKLKLYVEFSDNIPGVKGIGQVTASKLIREYGTVEVETDGGWALRLARPWAGRASWRGKLWR